MNNLVRRRVKTYMEMLVTVAFLTALDQWTKVLAVRHLKDQADITLIPDVLSLHYLENHGAAFGIFQNQKVFLLLLTFSVLGAIFYVLWKLPADRKYIYLKILSFLVAAGGIGNCIDRIRQGYVVDFFNFLPIDFPVFNVADIYVTISMILVFILVLFYYKEEDFSFLKWKNN